MPVRQFRVPEVTCQHCKTSIESAVSGLAGVGRVDVDLADLLVTVEGDAPEDVVRQAIEEVGYEVTGVRSL